MTKASGDGWATTQDGKLGIAGKTLQLPNLQLRRELGRGANAVVFEAFDMTLSRPVAVKVWNSHGRQRAHAETSKIAKLQHPLVVTTHSLQWAEGHPYAVMELVAGQSGKNWLATNPPIKDRARVWKLYSRAMRYVHEQGVVHGDPHTGNILVFPDVTGYFHDGTSDGTIPIGIKVADAGTSEFFFSRKKILKRESELILETAKRLFHDQDIDSLWSHPPNLTYQATLKVLDALAEYIAFTVEFPYSDHAAENAEILVRFALATPLFNLDGVLANIKNGHQTTVARFANRLNRDLLGVHDWARGSGVVGGATRDKYAEARAAYLQALMDHPEPDAPRVL